MMSGAVLYVLFPFSKNFERNITDAIAHHTIHLCATKYALKQAHTSIFSDNIPALLLYTQRGFCSLEERENYKSEEVALIHHEHR